MRLGSFAQTHVFVVGITVCRTCCHAIWACLLAELLWAWGMWRGCEGWCRLACSCKSCLINSTATRAGWGQTCTGCQQ
jgi:hypothetical protein